MEKTFFITLVRHGETMENRESVIQGQSDTSLSEMGRKQAALAGTRLQHEKFTHMFTSDLRRAADTAQSIVDANQVSTCGLVKDKRLRERSFGVMEGQKFSELQAKLKADNIPFKTYTPKEGESIEQVYKRAASFFYEICHMVASSSIAGQATTSSSTMNDSSGSSRITSMSSDSDASSTTIMHNTEKSLNIVRSSHPSSSSTSSSDLHSEDYYSREHSTDPNVCNNILIVTHGHLLKELKKMILNHYVGKLPENVASVAHRISPNTGVSKFVLSVSREGRMNVKCLETLFLDCKSHLRPLELKEGKESKY